MTTPLPSSPALRAGARRAVLACGLLAGAWLAGCASLNTVQSQVSSYGQWPAGRAAGSFAIERLPSQQTPEASPEQTELEQGAQAALQQAGFAPVAAGAAPDVVVQIGARVTRQDRPGWDDPFWWRGPFVSRWGFAGWPGPAWYGPHGGYGYGPYGYGPFGASRYGPSSSEYLREVVVLIRDRASGEALYEAHARSDGLNAGGNTVLAAMFAAALQGFPAVQPAPHPVQVALP
ncbi:MAG TPA: DUF4136 domain-containing protein [Ideonella sp.]|nr:DUF4136 domain-containing protein [Ideonella sp.]